MMTYESRLDKIKKFLHEQPAEYFKAYGITRESVMNDAALMKKLDAKYHHQVNNLELDPEWALQNAFDVAMTTVDNLSSTNYNVHYLVGDEVVVTIQGPYCKFRVTAYRNICGWDLKPGDLYIAKRNTGWQLAKCHSVNKEEGWVNVDYTKRIVYPYNCSECHKVKSIDVIPECGSVIHEQEDGYVCPNCDKCDSCDARSPEDNRCFYAEAGFEEWDLKE